MKSTKKEIPFGAFVLVIVSLIIATLFFIKWISNFAEKASSDHILGRGPNVFMECLGIFALAVIYYVSYRGLRNRKITF